jgi:hypothetical protein
MLLDALENPEVIEAIQSKLKPLEPAAPVIPTIDITPYERKIEALSHDLRQLEVASQNAFFEIQHLQQTLADRDKTIQALQENEKKLKADVDRAKQRYQPFADIDTLYQRFHALTPKTRNELSGIFKQDRFAGFISCGVQKDSVENLWDYTKNFCLNHPNSSDLKILYDLFRFFFDLYNATADHPYFERTSTKIGMELNTFEQILHPNSKQQGRIIEVLFEGYRNARKSDKPVVGKAVVRL